jgi:hypothetical protein
MINLPLSFIYGQGYRGEEYHCFTHIIKNNTGGFYLLFLLWPGPVKFHQFVSGAAWGAFPLQPTCADGSDSAAARLASRNMKIY